ncbi:keratocan isoform X1 [Acipenser ruthenus]|uniref:keratocan isoform X1 n=2 Tax=Acipenser ruthenus TaxID=7906 RepID=UPI0027416FC5|nr:keratocan isoform X1 [Acipenser ruthenus]
MDTPVGTLCFKKLCPSKDRIKTSKEKHNFVVLGNFLHTSSAQRWSSNMMTLTSFSVLLLASAVFSKDISYTDFLQQVQACPKECRCPPSFPNAVYCDSKGLKQIPQIPPHTWYLYLQNNLIDTVPETSLKNATQLKWINLNRNKITNKGIDKDVFNKMKNLLYLYMEDNELDDVPGPLPNSLEQLRLSRNKISKIPTGVFDGMVNLTMLDLQHNKLEDGAIPENTFKELKNLIQINLAKNNLKKMPSGLPATTMQLFLDNNSIEKIPDNYFSKTPQVSFLRLNYNKLMDGGLPKNIFNVSTMLDLQLSHNQLTKVPLTHPSLQHLHLDHNKIKSVNGTMICPMPIGTIDDYFHEKTPHLRYLRLDGNEIRPPIPMDLMMCFRRLQAVVI